MSEERNPYELYENATIAFQKLKAQKGDVIVITFPENIDPRQLQAAAEMFSERSKEIGVHIICAAAGITVGNLPEAELNAAGYYRLDKYGEPC